MTRQELEKELEALARLLGGGWRIEQDVMPVVILNIEEARKLRDRLTDGAGEGEQRTVPEITEVLELVDDLLVDAPDKAERHLALIRAILTGRTDDAEWLRSMGAKGV